MNPTSFPDTDLPQLPVPPALPKAALAEAERCIRCGFCLPVCPTYANFGRETSSPRGRLALMRGVAAGTLEWDEIAPEMFLCVACRACETACPAGVRYSVALEGARSALWETGIRHEATGPLGVLLQGLILYPEKLRLAAAALWFGQVTRLDRLMVRLLTALGERLPTGLRAAARFAPSLPRLAPPWQRLTEKAVWTANPAAPVRGRVGLLTGCVNDALLWPANRATARVLSHLGWEVVIVPNQQCCGALHLHAGDRAQARALARQNIAAFEAADCTAVVNNAGGCGATLKSYGQLLADDPVWSARAGRFSERVVDVSELLAELGPEVSLGSLTARVTYQDSCHLAHGQGVRMQPRRVLQRIAGLEYREMPQAEQCCGSGGLYNLAHPESSAQILARKMEQVVRTEPEIIATANPGCTLQMRLGVKDWPGQPPEVMHLIEVVERALFDPARLPATMP